MITKYENGDIVIAKIKKITYKNITLQTKQGTTYKINYNEVSDYPNKNLFTFFSVGDTINFVHLNCTIDKKKNKICYGSFKRNHPNESKAKINSKLQKTPGGFKALSNYNQLVINKYKKQKRT